MRLFTDVRRMKPEEQPLLWELAKTTDLERDWLAVWTRFKNWEKWPPVIAIDIQYDDAINAIHMFTASKTYLYTYFFWVKDTCRGTGLAHNMVLDAMSRMSIANISRWKLKCELTNDRGFAFWKKVGLRPIGKTDKEYYYDVRVDINDTTYSFNHDVTPDNRTLSMYKRQGVKFIHGSWEHLNG